MSGWMHLELNFNNYDSLARNFSKEAAPQKKPEGSYKELIIYLQKIVNCLSGLINRYFFLFEERPHLFLALEVKDIKDYETIKEKIEHTNKPNFIASHEIKFSTADGNHPEKALDLFCASAKYAFFRITDDYKPGYSENDEAKIIHCFCNQLFSGDWNNEKIFYLKGLFLRGALPFDIMVKNLETLGVQPTQIIEFLLLDTPDNATKLSFLIAFYISGFKTDYLMEFLKPMGFSQEDIIKILQPAGYPQKKIVEFSKLVLPNIEA